MKPPPTLHGADRSSSARHYSSALLIMAIAGLLNACGGGAGEPVVLATCITGTAPAVLTWDAVTGATGYRIYFGTTAGSLLPVVDVPEGLTTTTVTGLSSGTYYFAATAYDSSIPPNESVLSNVVCKTIS